MIPVTSDRTREPLLEKATIVTVVSGLVGILAAFGVHVRPELADAAVQLGTIGAVLLPLVTAWLARRHVTPVDDARDHDGTPLVRAEGPAGDAAP